MKKADVETTKSKLSALTGQPLRTIEREGNLIIVSLGDLVVHHAIAKDENREQKLEGKYELMLFCGMRMTCGDEILFGDGDIFIPCTHLTDDDKANAYDESGWLKQSSSYFDEAIAKYICDEPFEFVVKKVSVSKFGDLAIEFQNGFVLEVFADSSGESENWYFYEIDSKEPGFMVLGRGIDD